MVKLPKIKISPRLLSRKLWLALFAAIFPVLNIQFGWGFDEDVVIKVFVGLLSFVFIEGTADAVARFSNGK